MDEKLKDRDAGRLSFFIPGADLVQMEHHSMENMDSWTIRPPFCREHASIWRP